MRSVALCLPKTSSRRPVVGGTLTLHRGTTSWNCLLASCGRERAEVARLADRRVAHAKAHRHPEIAEARRWSGFGAKRSDAWRGRLPWVRVRTRVMISDPSLDRRAVARR